jgi:uncharacterized protein
MTGSSRIATLDAVRGFAVMGILLLNIVDFAMPGYAYVDPNYYGGATGVNHAVWAVVYTLFDGKMRGLFTMMFGASTVLIAERAFRSDASPARVHYARMASLFAIGMIHAYLVWYGDILVLYSVCGAIAFLVWRMEPRKLLALGVVLLLVKLVIGSITYVGAARFEAAATAPGASATLRQEWIAYRDSMAPPPETAAADLTAYRGSWRDALRARIPMTIMFQTRLELVSIPDTLALMAIGMALYRLGFFSGLWSRRRYGQLALWSFAICIPLYLPIIRWIDATRFSPVTLLMTEAIQLSLLRPFLSLAWAALVILFMQSGAARWLADRLAAAGRMAFSNYLGTSLLCTTFFNGYGLGWYGYLERWQCYLVVAAIWALILLWSKPWLDRFAYGPFEWLWRSLARWKIQPLRRTQILATDSQ